jgi:hypothetical protein
VLLVLLALTGRELDGTRVVRQHAAKGGAAKGGRPPSTGPDGQLTPRPATPDETPQGTTPRSDRG